MEKNFSGKEEIKVNSDRAQRKRNCGFSLQKIRRRTQWETKEAKEESDIQGEKLKSRRGIRQTGREKKTGRQRRQMGSEGGKRKWTKNRREEKRKIEDEED